MYNLILCEWTRIKKSTYIAAFIHSVLLALMVQFGLFISYDIGLKIVMVLIYAGCGYLFGITQLKKYTQKSQWTYLINRPISVKKIYLALLISTIIAITVFFLLPYLIVVMIIDHWHIELIDLRHYHQIVYLFGMILSFYLLSCFSVLIKSKSVHLMIMVCILPVMSLNLGGSVYWLLFGIIVLLFIMVFSAVKVNLDILPSGVIFQTTTALCYQYAIYFIIVSVFFFVSLIIQETAFKPRTQLKNDGAISQSFKELIRFKPQQASISALHTDDQRYDDLIEEIKLSETTRIRKRIWFQPSKQQLSLIDENETIIADKDNGILWKFSHDLMLFIGEDVNDNRVVGYLGPNQAFAKTELFTPSDGFSEVPWVENDQLVVKNKVYQYQNNTQRFRLIFDGMEDEYLLNGLQHQGSVKTVVTSKHLYVFDSIDYNNEILPLPVKVIMPLPDDYNNLWDINITEVIDRFILTFLYGKSYRHDVYDAVHLSYEMTLSGDVNLINKKPLLKNSPLIVKDLDYMISPVWKFVLDYFPVHPGRDRYLIKRPQVSQLTTSTTISLIVLAFSYLFITLLLAKNRQLGVKTKWTWAILNMFIGLPGVFSFLFLTPKEQQIIKRV